MSFSRRTFFKLIAAPTVAVLLGVRSVLPLDHPIAYQAPAEIAIGCSRCGATDDKPIHDFVWIADQWGPEDTECKGYFLAACMCGNLKVPLHKPLPTFPPWHSSARPEEVL